jgi:hypothetical protein
MGGKGGSGGGQQPMEQPTPQTTGGWSAVGDTAAPAAKPKEEAKPPVIEGAANQTGQEAIAPPESQPYSPPGFGNYPASNTNLSPLGDTLVAGMQEIPGKPGPTVPQYQGQV